MKKALIIFLFLGVLLISKNEASAQLAVTDPTNLQQNIINGSNILNLGVTMDQIAEAGEKLEALKKASGWISTMSSVQDFIFMIETTVCIVKDLKVNFDYCIGNGLLSDNNSCLLDFNYKMNINQLQKTVDFINLMITDFSMDQAARLAGVNEAMASYRKAQQELAELNTSLKRIRYKDYYEKEYQSSKDAYVQATLARYK